MAVRNLTNWLKAYMEYTLETESPDSYHFWTAATLISAATKRRVHLELNQFKVYPNMYTILVGPSGARKTIATEIGIKIASAAGLNRFSNKITGAALIKKLVRTTETTMLSDKTALITTPMIIYSSELGVFMGSDAYGSGVLADLTDLYDCPLEWSKETISRDEEIVSAPYITMLAATTPQTLKDCIPIGAVGQGFTSRIMFVWANGRRKKVPIPPWGNEYAMLKSGLIADLKMISEVSGVFNFTEDGLRAYKKFYFEAPEPEEEFEDERLRGYASRKSTHLLKLSMVLSLAAGDSLLLSEQEISGAAEALKWMESGLGNVFAGHGNSIVGQDVVRVFKQVLNAQVGYITQQELTKMNYSNLGSNELTLVLQTLVNAGAIELFVATDPRNNKLTSIYRVVDKNFIAQVNQVTPKNLKNE